MIALNLYIILTLVNRMVIQDGGMSLLDRLLQKSLRYKHHREHYIQSFEEKVIPLGLKINNKPAFAPISEDFMINWKNMLQRAEYSLVQLLFTESQKVIKKLDSDIENELRNFGYESRDQVYLGLERKHTDFKKSLEKRRSKKWQRFRELHHQELQTNRSVNEKPQVMLPIANENNHSAVVRGSTNKDIETSIATENMRGNDVTKTTSEAPTVEMESIDAPASPLDNLGKIYEENITDNRVRRQRTKKVL